MVTNQAIPVSRDVEDKIYFKNPLPQKVGRHPNFKSLIIINLYSNVSYKQNLRIKGISSTIRAISRHTSAYFNIQFITSISMTLNMLFTVLF